MLGLHCEVIGNRTWEQQNALNNKVIKRVVLQELTLNFIFNHITYHFMDKKALNTQHIHNRINKNSF